MKRTSYRLNFSTKDKELLLDEALENAIKYIGYPDNGILYDFRRQFQFNDEPKYFQYSSQINDLHLDHKHNKNSGATGVSFFSREIAAIKCLAESLERYSLKTIPEKSIIYSKEADLNGTSINISEIASFSDKQRTEKNIFLNMKDTTFGWIKGNIFPGNEEVYIPAQLVSLSYIRKSKEPFIRFPISSGAAAGTTLNSAIYTGLCELVERDAYMIYYLNKLPPREVILKNFKNEEISKMFSIVKDYDLQIRVFDITTDIKIPTFMSVVLDKSGISPAITVGLKTDLDVLKGIIGSIQEAFQTRIWIRNEMYKFSGDINSINYPSSILERGLMWSTGKHLSKLDFILNTHLKIDFNEYNTKELSFAYKLEKALKEIKDKNMNIYFKDITPNTENIKKSKFKVVMVVVPKLHPLYLNENFPYHGGERIYNVPVVLNKNYKIKREDELNKFPHPFL